MKVLYITNSIGMGGASVALINILQYSVVNGIEPLVTCPAIGTFSAKLKQMNIPFIVIRNPLEIYPHIYSWKSYIKYPYSLLRMILKRHFAYKKLCACIESFKPDIIHTNVGPIHIGFLAAKKYGIPHVWHIREYQKEDFDMHPFPSMKVYLKRIHDKNNHCISITKNIFEYFKLNPLKDMSIYDGVINKNEAKPINKNKKNYILFAGRLSDAKGTKDLIRVFDKYVQNGGRYNLYIAGKGEKEYIKECVDMLSDKSKNRVKFLGECEHTTIYKLMYEAAIFVVPSRREGFGFITAEAMFNGTIVIGKNTGGTKEQFDNGEKLMGENIAFRYNKEDELLRCLFHVQQLSLNEYERIASLAEKTVCHLYDNETQAEKILCVYKNVVKSNQYCAKLK